MAYSIRFSGIGKDGKKTFWIEPHWWVISEMTRAITPNWVVSNKTGSYQDEDADISLDEARKLHQLFKPELLRLIAFNTECVESEKKRTGEYASIRLADYTKCVKQLNTELELIESALGKDAGSFSHFHVCIFEWESGH